MSPTSMVERNVKPSGPSPVPGGTRPKPVVPESRMGALPPKGGRPSLRLASGWAAALAVLLAAGAVWYHSTRDEQRLDRRLYPRSLAVPSDRFTLIPESERPLDRVVMGLNPVADEYWLLPKVEVKPGMDPKRLEVLRKIFYWINLELAHGHIWSALPPDTEIFIGIPVDPKTKEPSSTEPAWFKEYLRLRWGWSGNAVRRRVRFFNVSEPVVWGQDIGEVLGRDEQDRTVIAIGSSEPAYYRDAVGQLTQKYSSFFTERAVGASVSTEGGDLELVWNSDGKPLLLAGRHSVNRFMERTTGGYDPTQPTGIGRILEARRAFAAGFYGLPVRFLPESVLLDPSRGDPELFHMDMLASVIADSPSSRAFVPTYIPHPRDSSNDWPLDPKFVRRLQSEYDDTALQLMRAGFEVVRLPFDDHPVRSPVNFVKYRNPADGHIVVMLAKYPNHMPQQGESAGQSRILSSLENLRNRYWVWQTTLGEADFMEVIRSSEQVWTDMSIAARETSPVFDAQSALIRRCGYEVVPVPMFAWGAGGLHCQVLH